VGLGIRFFEQSELPGDGIGRELVGRDFGGVGACVIFVDAAPGEGPRLHRHPYVEILAVLEGAATFNDGSSKRVVRAGEVAIVDANQPHAFVNSGQGRLRQIDVHLSPEFITEWLEPERA
jgi:mannose-6-phosphate isomerase-like protein (cupin superfamily)